MTDVEKLKETIRDDMGEHLGGNILLCQEHAIKYALEWLNERGLLVRDGFVVVPREPDDAVLEPLYEEYWDTDPQWIRRIYRDIVSASQEAVKD